jgi:hypothetical protein
MFVSLSVLKSVCIILVINDLSCSSTPASPHIHTHHHQEREEDGGYSARDKNHIVNGQHHSEFDHEAILGANRTVYIFTSNKANSVISLDSFFVVCICLCRGNTLNKPCLNVQLKNVPVSC